MIRLYDNWIKKFHYLSKYNFLSIYVRNTTIYRKVEWTQFQNLSSTDIVYFLFLSWHDGCLLYVQSIVIYSSHSHLNTVIQLPIISIANQSFLIFHRDTIEINFCAMKGKILPELPEIKSGDNDCDCQAAEVHITERVIPPAWWFNYYL